MNFDDLHRLKISLGIDLHRVLNAIHFFFFFFLFYADWTLTTFDRLVQKMAATETRSSDGVVYVKRDLYPQINSTAMEDDDDIERRHCDDDEDDDVDHRPPVLKLARYAISPTVPSLLSLHHHHHNNSYNSSSHHLYGDSHQMTSPIPRRKQARPRRRSGDSSSSPPAVEQQHGKFNFGSTPSPVQDMPEDLSIKKSSPSLVSFDDLIINQ